MPYVSVTTAKTLTPDQKDKLKSEIGQKITVIPGKSESVLMVNICDGSSMYFQGEAKECAYVDIKLYGAAELEHKKLFAEALGKSLEEIAGLNPGNVFLTYSEFSNWGMGGSLR